MYIDRDQLEEYPYEGEFYIPADGVREDGDLLSDMDEAETVVLLTECDIQETTKGWTGGAITASFNVYFPFCEAEGMPVRRGMMFRSTIYTMPINGSVAGIFPCQLGGCVAYIKDVNV